MNENNLYPDISGLFNINENEIPTEIIKKDPTVKAVTEPVLNSESALKTLPKKARKPIKKDNAKLKRSNFMKKSGKKMIITVVAVISAIIVFLTAGFFIADAQKTIVYCEKPAREDISVHSDAIGITYAFSDGMKIFFVDNEYDIHSVEAGQKVIITSSEVKSTGTVYSITEEAPGSETVAALYSVIGSENIPEAAVYAVVVSLDSPELFTEALKPVSVNVLTSTSADTLTVREGAVQQDEEGSFVWVYSSWSRSLTKKYVTTGISSDGKIEITSGIRKSSRVVYDSSCPLSELNGELNVKAKR